MKRIARSIGQFGIFKYFERLTYADRPRFQTRLATARHPFKDISGIAPEDVPRQVAYIRNRIDGWNKIILDEKIKPLLG